MSEKIETVDDTLLNTTDIENRIAELEKERPNYKYISGVGFYWNASKSEKIIEYYRLIGEHERLLKLAESLEVFL